MFLEIEGNFVSLFGSYYSCCMVSLWTSFEIHIIPQFRSIIPCEVLLYIEVAFLGFIH